MSPTQAITSPFRRRNPQNALDPSSFGQFVNFRKLTLIILIILIYLERIFLQPMPLPSYSGFATFVYLHTIIGVARVHRLTCFKGLFPRRWQVYLQNTPWVNTRIGAGAPRLNHQGEPETPSTYPLPDLITVLTGAQSARPSSTPSPPS